MMVDLVSLSKFLSYVLRHHPESIGVEIDKNGWVAINELITKAEADGRLLSRKKITKVIEHSNKQRFIISEDGQYIRAGYGHSIDVDLQLHPKQPPEVLYHGTAQKNVQSILEEGLHSGSRNFVHLSAQKDDAKQVGARHGMPVILEVLSQKMAKNGIKFYQSESEPDIWLTKQVLTEYIEEM
ncbi:RNA 2'-phosphotransferase [Aliifodinibius halophilus]|uniref:Probable RNA 2'-phosphotransferase n=2 Tax=Fodinibius halophilus TaxID=1736908 RepID=A0A6M1T430_9BACT|nr:RNA 2'-phosphotransferase [Fodinibius halophilus]